MRNNIKKSSNTWKKREQEAKTTQIKLKVISMSVNTPTGCGLVIPPRIEGWWCNPLDVGVVEAVMMGGGGGGGGAWEPDGLDDGWSEGIAYGEL